MFWRRDAISQRRICKHTIGDKVGQVDVDHIALDQNRRFCSSAPQHPTNHLTAQNFRRSNPTDDIDNRLEYCVGSIEGWLIMVDYEFLGCELSQPKGLGSFQLLSNESRSSSATVHLFFNPTSGDRVMLPLQSTIPFDKSSTVGLGYDNSQLSMFKKVVASSAPTSPHCVVAGLLNAGLVNEDGFPSQGRLAFCRPTDISWTLIDDDEVSGLEFCDIEIIDGRLYAATREASEFIVVFDIQDAIDNVGPPTHSVEYLVMLNPGPIPLLITRRDVELRDCIYLAKDCTSNELFMVFRRNIVGRGNFVTPPKTVGFQLFKLEFTTNGPQWAKVAGIGDRVLFVSNARNTFFPANSGLNCDSGDATLDRNCICFAFGNPCSESPSSGCDVGVFSLTNNSVPNYKVTWFKPNHWLLR